jgi:flagellum-specific peptidoglycan hydrolase FlgJ
MEYRKWAKGLKRAGYATNPKYAEALIAIIERYDLWVYDVRFLNSVL